MDSGLRDVVERRRLNALLGWAMVCVLVLTAAVDAIDADYLWAGFALAVALVLAVPAVALRSWEALPPAEVMALATLPVVVRAFIAGQTVGSRTLTGRVSTYLAVAAVALVVAVELDVFTSVRMTESFAVAFVAVTTTATAGIYALAQWSLDVVLGTGFLLDGRPETVVERALMLDFLAATVAGVAAGVIFSLYFRRRTGGYDRAPTPDSR